jgi:hypothetical protein
MPIHNTIRVFPLRASTGVEAKILRNGELALGRRFVLKEQAVRWAEEERAHARERLEFSE